MWLLLAAAAALAVAAALGAQHERPTPDTLLSAAPVPATAAAPGAVAAGDTSVPQAGAVFSGQGAAPPVLPTPTF